MSEQMHINESLRRVLRQDPVTMAARLLCDSQTMSALERLSGHDGDLCGKVLTLCAPMMEQPPFDHTVWLTQLRDRLIGNLFPDAEHCRTELCGDEAVYLRVLEETMQWNPEGADPLRVLLRFDESAMGGSRVARQYQTFTKAVQQSHILALLRLSRELGPFDLEAHTIGVHNIALHTAVMAAKAGLAVDLPLVSAAAFGHDIGKFGCRGDDQHRVPYLHYYYTWQWFIDHGMEDIGYISANHSTWDLEFENLPIESLLLIYADFRVRGQRGADGREVIGICSLEEAYECILSKLADVTPEKKQRYQTVYYKLRDFERLLESVGVPLELNENELKTVEHRDYSLLSADEALQALRHMALHGSMKLMQMISTTQSFELLLEQAKGEKNLQRIRTYLRLLEEYSNYMTVSNKKKTLRLLYELLMHTDGDVRRISGQIMGRILANSGLKNRKERPMGARSDVMNPAVTAMLDESVELWDHYIEKCLHPDHKISHRHAQRISNSLKTVCESLFARCEEKEAAKFVMPLLKHLYAASGADRFVRVDALTPLPYAYIPDSEIGKTVEALGAMLSDGDTPLRLRVLRCLEKMYPYPQFTCKVISVVSSFDTTDCEDRGLVEYLRQRAMGERHDVLDEDGRSRIYLSNLKSAVHWTVKLAHIDMLCDHVKAHPETALHTAMHLSNVLSVSEHLPVRQSAGEHLLEIAAYLTEHHINEIAVDLMRELESGQDQISYVITPYLGRLLCMLPEKELWEAEDFVESLVRSSAVRPARAGLRVVGEMLNVLGDEQESMIDRTLGLLMTGINHYEPTIHQSALAVLCRDVFGSARISLERRSKLFCRLHKKLLTVLAEPREGQLTFFNSAAMLNYLYRFIVQCEVKCGEFRFPAPKPAAFFPGTFDPFSVGHKQIVEEIRKLGYEVYLAIDEFSWSKMPLPKLLRRQIVSISVADQWDTYLFPDDIPINIAMPEDLALLRGYLSDRPLYLVAGSDVIYNASAYRSEASGSAAEYDHIIFCRNTEDSADPVKLREIIRGELKLLSLPPFFESVSSTRIREFIDLKLDISMLVDPVVQALIYQYGLYVRAPELKNMMTLQDVYFSLHCAPQPGLPEELNRRLAAAAKPLAVTLCARPDSVLGWVVGHTLQASNLYDELHSIEAAKYVRRYASGHILMIRTVSLCGERSVEHCRMLLNELLARSLTGDHTYALCRCAPEDTALRQALQQLGFVPVASCDDIYCVDMRAPVILLQDVLLRLKQPHQSDDDVKRAVLATRPKLRGVLNSMFAGNLLLCFDSEMLNQSVMERVQKINGVENVPQGVRQLGPYMCVPYGKILSNEVVPNTVTKTLRAEKKFASDVDSFDVVEYPGYSPLKNQVRTLRSFRRPVILVDDLLHKGYRIEKLDRVLREEGLTTGRIVVAMMSGYGQDLMRVQGREAECEYFIPNLRYWFTESLLYPFIGGDSIGDKGTTEHLIPSINLVLPYYFPHFIGDVTDEDIRRFSCVALENALELMQTLEKRHQEVFNTTLTIRRLGEALQQPRLPDKGVCMKYDMNLPASAYLQEDLRQIQRICRGEKEQE